MIISASSPSKNFSAVQRKVSVVKMVVLGGGQGFGCSSFVRAFTSGSFERTDESGYTSLGAKFYSKMLLSKDDTIRFQIWDLPGASSELVAPIYYSTANVGLVCFDLSREKTLKLAEQTLRRIASQKTPNTIEIYILVGCKLDLLPSGRGGEKLLEEAAAVAEANGCSAFSAISAKDLSLGELSIQKVFLNAALLKLEKGGKGSRRYLKPPEWSPDSAACFQCQLPFTATRRRHHCRNCGQCFDSACCSVFRPLPRFGVFQNVRCCLDCATLLDNNDTVKNGEDDYK